MDDRPTKIAKADKHAQKAEEALEMEETWTHSTALRAQIHAELASYWLERSRYMP